jgi:hypothetical protein
VQIPRSDGGILVPRDPLEDVQLDSRVRHPGQGRVAQTVTHESRLAQLGNQCVPPGRVAEGSGGNYAAAWTDDQAFVASSTQ